MNKIAFIKKKCETILKLQIDQIKNFLVFSILGNSEVEFNTTWP